MLHFYYAKKLLKYTLAENINVLNVLKEEINAAA